MRTLHWKTDRLNNLQISRRFMAWRGKYFSRNVVRNWVSLYDSTFLLPSVSQGRRESVKGETVSGSPDLKMGPGNYEIKRKTGQSKEIFLFWGPNLQASRALGWSIQPIQSWTYKWGGARKYWFHGTRPGSRRPWQSLLQFMLP
jgi:hypothetical protein